MPQGSFSMLHTQSPSEQLSRLRLPNQPSSSTNSSTPIFRASSTMAISFSSVKSK